MPAFEVDNTVVCCDMVSNSQPKCDKDQSCLLNSSPARGNLVRFPDCCVQNTEQDDINPQIHITS